MELACEKIEKIFKKDTFLFELIFADIAGFREAYFEEGLRLNVPSYSTILSWIIFAGLSITNVSL